MWPGCMHPGPGGRMRPPVGSAHAPTPGGAYTRLRSNHLPPVRDLSPVGGVAAVVAVQPQQPQRTRRVGAAWDDRPHVVAPWGADDRAVAPARAAVGRAPALEPEGAGHF